MLSDTSFCVSETSNYLAFVNIHACVNVTGFSFGEQAAMNFTDGHDASRLCQDPFPDRKQPNHQNFAAVYRQLAQTATFTPVTAERGRPSVARTPGLEKRVLQHVAGGLKYQQERTRGSVPCWPYGRLSGTA